MASQFVEDNRKFFDDLADKYDVKEWTRVFAVQTAQFIQQNVGFIGLSPAKPESSDDPEVSLLDYACGTGALSRALGPFVSHIQGIDLSGNMIERYKTLAASSTIPSVRKASAVVGNLVAEGEPPASLSGPEFRGFSVAGVTAGFHHLENHQLAIDRLVERLRPGGILLILDFVEEDKMTHPTSDADKTIKKHAFREEEMKALMEKAGLVKFGWKVAGEPVKLEMDPANPVYRKLFLARAERK